MKAFNALSIDNTEHDVYYYLASAVDAELAKKDAENQRLLDSLHTAWQEIKTEQRLSFRTERDALKAENLGYAKSLLNLEAEVERLTAASNTWCEAEKKL
jgi:phage host-nuclease inhibitor protein Gam